MYGKIAMILTVKLLCFNANSVQYAMCNDDCIKYSHVKYSGLQYNIKLKKKLCWVQVECCTWQDRFDIDG